MRKSVKLFSILLALAVVISVVPVAGALADGVEVADTPEATAAADATTEPTTATEPEATETAAPADGNVFAPQNLRWEGTTLLWDPPYPMPTAEDMGPDFVDTQYLLEYEVKLYKTDSDLEPESPFITSYAPIGIEGSVTYDSFINVLTDGGTFYFTVRLVAMPYSDSREPLWHGDLATSAEKTIEKLPKPSWENNEVITFISKEIDFDTLDITEKLMLFFGHCENNKVGQVEIEWYYSDKELSEEEFANRGHSSMLFDHTNMGTYLLSDEQSLDTTPYIYIRYRYIPKSEDDVASEWSDFKSYNDELVQKDMYALPAVSQSTVQLHEDGLITWEAPEGLSAAEGYETLSYELTLCKKSGEVLNVERNSVVMRDSGQDIYFELASDIYRRAFTGEGEYVLFINMYALNRTSEPPYTIMEHMYSDYVKYEIPVPEGIEDKLPAPENLTRSLSKAGSDGWSEIIAWPYEDERAFMFEFEACSKRSDGQWLAFSWGEGPFDNHEISYECSRLSKEAEVKIRIRALSDDISKVLSSEWAEVELNNIPITLTENLFSVNTDDAVYDGNAKTKEIIPEDIPDHPLIQDTDYTVTYANNTEVGTATITITGIGKYTGELTYKFNITAAPSGGGSAGGGDDYDDDDDYYTPPTPSDVIESTTNTDGSVTQTATHADGSKTETTTTADGVVGTVERSSTGEIVSAEVTVSASAVGGIVTAPLEVTASADSASAPEISVKTPAGSVAKVEIPVTGVGPGTVAVKVNPDGTEEVIRDCVDGKSGVIFSAEGDVTVKIVERSSSFTDMSGNSAWASDAVEFVAARELFNGTGNNNFTPAGTMSRGMMVTVLYRLAYEPETADTGAAFDDVGGDKFYSEAVAWAADNNVANGYRAGIFSPDDNVTREQLVTMLYRYAKSGGWDVTASQSSLSGFADGSAVHDYAKDAMAWAVSAGIILGNNNGDLSPEGCATRAEAATILMRFCKNIINAA